jgi:hypothetical protein
VRVFDHARTPVEVVGGIVNNDAQESAPAYITGGTSSVVQGTRAGVGSGWYVEPDNSAITDVASAAITTTTTTAAIAPVPQGAAARFAVQVVSVSGTAPTMDVVINASYDNGSSYRPIYFIERITASGTYETPTLQLDGVTRITYTYTITGTSPSFTRSTIRTPELFTSVPRLRRLIDRTVAVGTLSSTTPSLKMDGGRNLQLVLKMAAITTTAPALQLQGSDDGGLSWYALGAALAGVANNSVQLTVQGVQADQVRAIVTTGGVGATLDHVVIKSF